MPNKIPTSEASNLFRSASVPCLLDQALSSLSFILRSSNPTRFPNEKTGYILPANAINQRNPILKKKKKKKKKVLFLPFDVLARAMYPVSWPCPPPVYYFPVHSLRLDSMICVEARIPRPSLEDEGSENERVVVVVVVVYCSAVTHRTAAALVGA